MPGTGFFHHTQGSVPPGPLLGASASRLAAGPEVPDPVGSAAAVTSTALVDEPNRSMLRLMVMRRQAGTAAVMLLVTACGSGTGSQDSANPERGRLLAAADAAAKGHDGEARRVEVVKTTRGAAADLTGHCNPAQGEEVWVVQVSGDDYVCDVCSRPAGAASPGGQFMTLVLRVSDFEGTDFGMSANATDLARYGQVEVLRDQG